MKLRGASIEFLCVTFVAFLIYYTTALQQSRVQWAGTAKHLTAAISVLLSAIADRLATEC